MEDTTRKLENSAPELKDQDNTPEVEMDEAELDEVSGGKILINRPPHWPPPYNPIPPIKTGPLL